MQEKRILFIGNFLSKIQGTIGPTEIMANRFSDEGKSVIMASSKPGKFLRQLDMLLKSAFSQYDKICIDVYSSTALIFALFTSWVAKHRGKDIIMILHGGGLKHEYAPKKNKINRLLRRAKHIVTPSHYLERFFISKGYQIEYLPNTIDLSLFSFQPRESVSHKILWVRAFTDNYNPDMAVRVFSDVVKLYPDASLTMVGPDKGNLERIKKLIGELELDDKVIITGRIENKDLPEIYHSHDVYLNTTSYESFGVALMEAASCGVPIVSTSVGEIPLIWAKNVDILLADLNDEGRLVKHIITLFENKGKYESIRTNAYNKSQIFSWEMVSKRWNQILFE